jgi:hypothetical protein
MASISFDLDRAFPAAPSLCFEVSNFGPAVFDLPWAAVLPSLRMLIRWCGRVSNKARWPVYASGVPGFGEEQLTSLSQFKVFRLGAWPSGF